MRPLKGTWNFFFLRCRSVCKDFYLKMEICSASEAFCGAGIFGGYERMVAQFQKLAAHLKTPSLVSKDPLRSCSQWFFLVDAETPFQGDAEEAKKGKFYRLQKLFLVTVILAYGMPM